MACPDLYSVQNCKKLIGVLVEKAELGIGYTVGLGSLTLLTNEYTFCGPTSGIRRNTGQLGRQGQGRIMYLHAMLSEEPISCV